MLRHALDVIEAWGFNYKTVAFYWVKLNQEPGGMFLTGRGTSSPAWASGPAPTRRCACWATRGHPKRRATDVAKLLLAPRREHSRKPEEAHARIERLVDGPYLELFARATRPGWDRLGNQAELFDEGPVRTRRRPSAGRRRWPQINLG